MVEFTKTFYGRENESLEKEIKDKKDSPQFVMKLIEQSPEFKAHMKAHQGAKLKPREDKKELSDVEKVTEKWEKEVEEKEAKEKKPQEKAKGVEYGTPEEKKGEPIYGQPGAGNKSEDIYGAAHSLGHYDCNCGASFELKENKGKPAVSYISPTEVFKEENKGPGYSGIKTFASQSSTTGYASGSTVKAKELYR